MTRRLFAPVSYSVLTLLAAATLLPFVWMVLTALKPETEVFNLAWLPSRPAWENFPRAFTFFPFARFLTNTIVLDIYQNGFQFFRMGYASAIAWALFVVIFIFTLFQMRLQGRWVQYD